MTEDATNAACLDFLVTEFTVSLFEQMAASIKRRMETGQGQWLEDTYKYLERDIDTRILAKAVKEGYIGARTRDARSWKWLLYGLLHDDPSEVDEGIVNELTGGETPEGIALRKVLGEVANQTKRVKTLKKQLDEATSRDRCDSERRTVNDLKDEIDRLKKQLDASNAGNPECSRYVDYINVQNSKIASLSEYKTMYEKLRSEYDVLLGRYEMLRLQYVRVRTEKSVRAISMPQWTAGMPSPFNAEQRILTDLAGADVTKKALRRACGEESPSSSESEHEEDMRRSRNRAMEALKKAKVDAVEAEKETY